MSAAKPTAGATPTVRKASSTRALRGGACPFRVRVAASAWADLNGVWDAERTGCVFAEGNGYYPAAGYINIMSASGSGGGAEAGTSGYCWSASSAGRNGYALTYSVSAIKTEAELTKAWACPVRCVKDVK